MKRAGDVLSVLFDEGLMKKAQGYSKLFSCWKELAERHGIAAAAAHSRITGLDRGILWVEVDHPGWKQILQTKESRLLNDLRRRFPDLDISGISIFLGKGVPAQEAPAEDESVESEAILPPGEDSTPDSDMPLPSETSENGYNAIKDEEFKKTLKRLEQSISEKEQINKPPRRRR
jgi:hypothetical protein